MNSVLTNSFTCLSRCVKVDVNTLPLAWRCPSCKIKARRQFERAKRQFISGLERKNDNLIYVRNGTIEHPAYEMQSLSEVDSDFVHDGMVWIEWANGGSKEEIDERQIVRRSLPATRNTRNPNPNYCEE